MMGQQMTLVAVPYQVYALTGSSLLVGVTSMVALVPLIVFGLLGGAIADSMDRRTLMLITSTGAAVTSALLALQALLPGGGNLAVLWVLTACVSGFTAVNQPTRSAVIPALVGPSGIAAANALSMTVRQIGVIAGPLLAGLLIGAGSLFLAYAVDALGFLIAVLLLRGLPSLPPAGVLGPLRLGAAIRGVGEGFAFLRTQPVLLMTFVVDIIAMLFAWPQAVFPELSETRFEGSPNSLGWLFAGISIGALVMGLTSGWVTRIDRQGAVVLGAIAVWGVAIIGFGLAPTLWLAVLCLAVSGAADMVSAVLRTSMLQEAAPDEMRGRMQGVFLVVVAGGPRLGDLRAGAIASMYGVSVAMVSGGVIIVVAMAVVARRRPVVLVVPGLGGAGGRTRGGGPAGLARPREWREPTGPHDRLTMFRSRRSRRPDQPACGCLATRELDVDVPAVAFEYGQTWWVRSISARAFLVVDQRGGQLELGRQAELGPAPLQEVHAGGDVRALEILRRQPDVLDREAHRAVEAGRVAGREQLLRVGARPVVATHVLGPRELQVEPVVGRDHRAGPLPVGAGLCRVEPVHALGLPARPAVRSPARQARACATTFRSATRAS